jgi:glycerol-3-phosphate acyltransferase PlsY
LIGALAVTIWVACAYPAGILSAAGLFAIGICGLLMFKHRENLARLVAGTESRFERLRFMGRLFDRMAGAWRVG